MSAVKVPIAYVVEDDEPTRRRLVDKLRGTGLVTVPVQAGSCSEILDALSTGSPDLLLVDLGLPDGSGVEVVQACTARHPSTLIMVMTAFGDEKSVMSAIRAGATGYLLKDDSAEDIAASLRQMFAGGSPLSPAVTRHLIRHIRPEPDTRRADEPLVHLSPRELQVLSLAHKGFSYAEIAELMGVTPTTVAGYTRRIYVKLAVSSRSEAVFEAMKMGLIDAASLP